MHEVLIRVVYSPQHVEADTSRLKPTALDDASNKGLSTDRRQHTTIEEVQARITKKLNEPRAIEKGHEYKGVVVIPCGAVRGLSNDGKRLFAVYDTAQEGNHAHADVCQVRLSKVEGAMARKRLIAALRNGDQPEWLPDAFRD
jgi:glutamate 5-kinase